MWGSGTNCDSAFFSYSLDNHIFSLSSSINFPVLSCLWRGAFGSFIDVVCCASSSHVSLSFVETVDKHWHQVLHLLWCQSREAIGSLALTTAALWQKDMMTLLSCDTRVSTASIRHLILLLSMGGMTPLSPVVVVSRRSTTQPVSPSGWPQCVCTGFYVTESQLVIMKNNLSDKDDTS